MCGVETWNFTKTREESRWMDGAQKERGREDERERERGREGTSAALLCIITY